MERAEGASLWRVDGDAESNAHDRIEVSADRVAWEVRAFGAAAGSRLEATEPAARRFMSRVLAEKRRIAQRSVVRPAPKPVPLRRPRVRATELVECPGCAGGSLDCACCGGDGWVTLAAAEAWRR